MMRLQTRELLAELKWTQRFADSGRTIPILGNVLIEAAGKQITLTATDSEIAGVSQLDGDGKADWTVAVPVRQLIKYLEKITDPVVNLKEDKLKLLLSHSNGGQVEVMGMSKESYPELPQIPTTCQLYGLERALPRITPSISTEVGRFSLNGALLDGKNGDSRLISTDGHRLSIISVGYDGPAMQVLIRADALNELRALKADRVSFGHDDQHLAFKYGSRRIISRKLEGTFPDYHRMLPKDFPHFALLPAAETLKVLERVAVFADKHTHAVRFRLAPGTLTIQAEDCLCETGKAAGTIALSGGDQSGISIGLNAVYAADFLKQAEGTVAFCWIDAKSISVFQGADEWRYALMPMRI